MSRKAVANNPRPRDRKQSIPQVGFVSLGCPKALVDSERILTQLRAEGYDIAPSYDGADLVVVNTCGFIDAAVEESLDAIGEALNQNGRVIVTGCLGAKGDIVRQTHPKVLAVTGPHALDEVMTAVHAHLPRPHDPYADLVPPAGIKLTPRHYAYLKIAEGCNHRCTFCIIPSMRGDLVSRDIGQVMQEAENLVKSGVRELLVISQDTSAYGVDVKYRTGFWAGKPLKTRMTELAQALGGLGVWVRLHYVYPYPHVDEVIPLMADGKILPYLDVPFQHASPRILKLMKRPASAENTLARIRAWREICPDITLRSTFCCRLSGRNRRRFHKCCWSFLRRRSSTVSAASPIRRSKARRRMRCPSRAGGIKAEAAGAFHGGAGTDFRRNKLETQNRQDPKRARGRGAGRWHRRRPFQRRRARNRRRGVHRGGTGPATRRLLPSQHHPRRRTRFVGPVDSLNDSGSSIARISIRRTYRHDTYLRRTETQDRGRIA